MSRSWLDRLGLHRPELRAWALYDVANSAWMTTVMTAVFPPFFVALATGAGLSDPAARSRFAFASSLSVILVGLSGPIMGAIADLRGIARLARGLWTGSLPLATIDPRRPVETVDERIGLGRQLLRFGAIGLASTAFFAVLYLLLRGPFGAQTAKLTPDTPSTVRS